MATSTWGTFVRRNCRNGPSSSPGASERRCSGGRTTVLWIASTGISRGSDAKTRGAVAALAERIPVPKVIGDALAKGAARGADDSLRKLRLDPDQ